MNPTEWTLFLLKGLQSLFCRTCSQLTQIQSITNAHLLLILLNLTQNLKYWRTILHMCFFKWARVRVRVSSVVKNLPAKQETRVRSLGWDDPLEKEMATHSSILVWKIPWTQEPAGV